MKAMSKEKTPEKKYSMTFLPQKKKCAFAGDVTVLQVAIDNDLPLNHSCGGMGSCTTCKVFVREGLNSLPAPDDVEAEHVRMRGFAPYERLACQIPAKDGLVAEIPKSKALRR